LLRFVPDVAVNAVAVIDVAVIDVAVNVVVIDVVVVRNSTLSDFFRDRNEMIRKPFR